MADPGKALNVTSIALFVAVFLACIVEAVEALTILLAAGTTRGWRSALIGGLLLVFGVGWLRKAIMRAAGLKALHDEDKIFAEKRAAAQAATSQERALVGDWYAFTLSFKG